MDKIIMNLQDRVQKLKNKIKKFRQCGLEKNGQYSIENLVFKVLRRNGYLTKLSKIGISYYDKKYSIKEKDLAEEDNFERKETHGYIRGELNKSGYDDSSNENAMGFWGLEGGSSDSNTSSQSFDKDFSSTYDDSSKMFDLKESLHKNLRKLL